MSSKKLSDRLRILIVAENASAKFGGEASLPMHYFRQFRARQIETWLIAHDRTRRELESLFPDDIDRLLFVPDTIWHRWLHSIGQAFPTRISNMTFGFVMNLLSQVIQHRMIRKMAQRHDINIIHQPIPVSPKQPSLLFDLGIPIVFGPMNGGMNYPPAFQKMENPVTQHTVKVGRLLSEFINLLMPGKRKADLLLVANQRTRKALPKVASHNVVELVENGVDLSIWHPKPEVVKALRGTAIATQPQQIRFIFVGRLVDWKAVDLLIEAFDRIQVDIPIVLEIIGNGPERSPLENQAERLGLKAPLESNQEQAGSKHIEFSGWLSQAECARRLQAADVMVLPSLLECGGAVVLEAMAVGLPVIATNWGGPADYVDASCGILVEPVSRAGFIEGLTAAMTKLASSPDLRLAMGQAGRIKAVRQFNWEAKTDQILDCYQSILPPLKKEEAVPVLLSPMIR